MESLPLWKAVFLGVVQGLTEFLPISSSAHLVIFQQWMELSKHGSFLLAFDVALHFGTLLAVISYFYQDLQVMIRSFVKKGVGDPEAAAPFNGRKLALFLVIGTIPAAVVGLAFKGFFEMLFADVIPASIFLMMTGLILWLTKKIPSGSIDFSNIKAKQALGVGLAQMVAILPGISRSGSTIAAGLFLKLTPETAARFSFLLAIPAISGAVVMELPVFAKLSTAMILPFVVGMLVSFAVGYASIRWLLSFIQTGRLYKFAWYCWGMGAFALLTQLF